MNMQFPIFIETIKNRLTELVSEQPGIRGVELAVIIVSEIYEDVERPINLVHLIEECSKEGRFIELKYTLPATEHRSKSRYWPAGTVFAIQYSGTPHLMSPPSVPKARRVLT
jgi:hypothetical protein